MNIKANSKPARTDKPILNLSKEQQWAASVWKAKTHDEIAVALGVSSEVLEGWVEHPRFLAEIAQRDLGLEPETEEIQAAALAFGDVSYAEAEAEIGLEEGTIMEWTRDRDSMFNSLLGHMRYLANPPPPFDDSLDKLDELSEEQIQALPLIIQGKTDAEVAEAIGKSRETVNRWRNHNDDFMERLEDARSSYLETQIAAVSARAQKPVAVLDELLDSEDEKIRLQAASLLLKSAPSLRG